jgi:hypothetical protein
VKPGDLVDWDEFFFVYRWKIGRECYLALGSKVWIVPVVDQLADLVG